MPKEELHYEKTINVNKSVSVENVDGINKLHSQFIQNFIPVRVNSRGISEAVGISRKHDIELDLQLLEVDDKINEVFR